MGLLSTVRGWTVRYPVLLFYVLTFGLEFGLVGGLTVLGLGLPPLIVAIFVFLPTIVAVLLSAIEGGAAGVKSLLGKFGVWRVGVQWYLFALLSAAAVALLARGLYTLAGGTVAPPHWYSLSMLLMVAIGGPLAEEAGWRGYVLPRLQTRMNALSASLIIGVLWGAVWHLPMFLGGGYTVPLGWYTLLCVAWALLFTWVYNHTGGSLLIAFLYHWAINVSVNMFPVFEGALFALYVALTWSVALAVVALFGPRGLARGAARAEATGVGAAWRPTGR